MSDIAMYLDPVEESWYSSLDATCIGSVAQKYTDPDSFPEIEAGQVVFHLHIHILSGNFKF